MIPTSERQARRGEAGSCLPTQSVLVRSFLAVVRTQPLTTLKLHYDGWLALPAGLRQTLDLKTGDRLVAELVDGTIVLRPAHGKQAPAEPEVTVGSVAVASAPAPSTEMTKPAKRPRGRPKTQTAGEPARQPELALDSAEAPFP